MGDERETMNWTAVGAIGQILGVLITFVVGCIALLPYMRKCDIYFSFMYNVDKKPTFIVTNNSQKGQFINRIVMYSGKWSRKSFCVIEMLDIQDDLLADNIEFFVAPNSYCKISADATRMVKYITHCDVYLSKHKKVYIKLDFGDKLSKRYCTQIRTYEFLQMLISETEAYQDFNVDILFNK